MSTRPKRPKRPKQVERPQESSDSDVDDDGPCAGVLGEMPAII